MGLWDPGWGRDAGWGSRMATWGGGGGRFRDPPGWGRGWGGGVRDGDQGWVWGRGVKDGDREAGWGCGMWSGAHPGGWGRTAPRHPLPPRPPGLELEPSPSQLQTKAYVRQLQVIDNQNLLFELSYKLEPGGQ